MRIDIKIDREFEGSFESYEDAIEDLKILKNNAIRKEREKLLYLVIKTHKIDDLARIFAECRCPKCIHEGTCSGLDIEGSCNAYKRDPPDGGYYG